MLSNEHNCYKKYIWCRFSEKLYVNVFNSGTVWLFFYVALRLSFNIITNSSIPEWLLLQGRGESKEQINDARTFSQIRYVCINGRIMLMTIVKRLARNTMSIYVRHAWQKIDSDWAFIWRPLLSVHHFNHFRSIFTTVTLFQKSLVWI